ncbi:MAG: XRE family transcriptional regulator [Dorea sp.]|nr:XRE family transcriptional regulator [Dorea sp.]MDY2814802.1 XRE family transcriptional regulator [Dorea sp.]
MDIGKKLRELRLQNDLTLEDLASRCELTKGFLSQVERNLTAPSIATLEDILEALGSNLSDFFHEEEERQIVFSTQDFFVDEQEDYQVEWVIPNAQKNQMEPILLTLYPHKKSHVLSAYQGEEFGYVLKGNVTIVCGSKKYKAKTHETFYMDGSKSHYLYNHGNSVAKILWITTPPMF